MSDFLVRLSPDQRIFAPGSAHRVAAVRTGLAVIIGLRVALGPYPELARAPDRMFQPPLVLEFLPGFPAVGVIVALQVVGTAGAVAAVLGWRPRSSFVAAWVSLLVLAGLRNSLGKLLHNDVMLLLAAVPFLLAPAEARWGQRLRSARYGWPPRLAMILVAGGYWFAALQKLHHSGLEWITGDNMRWVMYSAASTTARARTTDVAQFIADTPWLADLTAAAIVGFELGFPVVLFWPRIRPWVIAAAVALHVGTWLTLGLDYWAWLLTVAVVLFNWDGSRLERKPFEPNESVRPSADSLSPIRPSKSDRIGPRGDAGASPLGHPPVPTGPSPR